VGFVVTLSTWDDVRTLASGDHVHLDELVNDPPTPGSPDWIPIILELVTWLQQWGGNWMVTLPVGAVHELPRSFPTLSHIFDSVDTKDLVEPPAAYHLDDMLKTNTWVGEAHHWQQLREPGVMEVASFRRTMDGLRDGENLDVSILLEVRPAN
jgi:hypothetical protein